MSNSEKVTIVFQTITCKGTSDGKNLNDELYLIYNVDGGKDQRFPDKDSYSIDSKNNNTWSPDLPVSYSENVVMSLYDSEAGKDQFLRSETYLVADASKTENREVTNSNGADYIITTVPG